jgi:DNA-binding MarR family transcriptional regulator
MGTILQQRLKQAKFQSPQHEAVLALFVAASDIRSRVDKKCDEFGISGQQYNILRILRGSHPDGHSCGEIGRRMIERSPDITRRIDGLEKLGLVERTRSTEDRRVVITRITQKGLDVLERLDPDLQAVDTVLHSKLSEEEWTELTRLCETLITDNGDACGKG